MGIVIGDTSSNTLHSLKRVVLDKRKGQRLVLEFVAPELAGDYNLSLFCMNDSYLGCDLEFSIELSVVAPGDTEDDNDDDDDDDDDDEVDDEERRRRKRNKIKWLMNKVALYTNFDTFYNRSLSVKVFHFLQYI